MKDTVLIRVNNLPYDVERGNSAVIEAVLDWADNVLVLPNHLVKPSSNGYYVKVMEDGIVNQRDVKIGIKSATLTEIRGGIEAGDLIVE